MHEILGKIRSFLGWFLGLLFGSAFFFILGARPLLITGSLVSCIIGGLAAV
jgi:hypothetical protein